MPFNNHYGLFFACLLGLWVISSPAASGASPVIEKADCISEGTHDFHISKTRLEYVAERAEWQLSLHVFIDDLERALVGESEVALFLGSDRETGQADSLIHSYLRAKLDLQQNEQSLQLEWLGKEVTEDLSAFWVYLYVPDAPQPGKLTLANRILLELYDDQQNIVHCIGPGGTKQHLLFHRDQQRENLQF